MAGMNEMNEDNFYFSSTWTERLNSSAKTKLEILTLTAYNAIKWEQFPESSLVTCGR